MRQNPAMWGNRQENEVMNKSERLADSSDLIEGYKEQVRIFVQGGDIQRGNQKAVAERARRISSFINLPDFELIRNQTENRMLPAAEDVAKRNPHLLPDIFPVDGQNPYRHKGAFLVALVKELEKPEYKQ
jgi:hypothetical protein